MQDMRTWIDVDLDKLVQNYRTACSLTSSLVTCVVKSNAYGHGAVRVAQALEEAGCRSFAVSCAREALELRKAGISSEVLVMALAEKSLMKRCVGENITLSAGTLEDLKCINDAACELGKIAAVHIKLDTGFHRLGFECTDASAKNISDILHGCPNIFPEALFTHLGLVSRERDIMQHENLLKMQQLLKNHGVDICQLHICDSIGLVRYPEFHHSRVRVGALLYGVRPSRSESMPFDDFETMTFHTSIAQIHHVAKGEYVGYSDDAPLLRDSVIATLCAGYGDGYPRCLSCGVGKVAIHGELAPVVGLVCMDQMMVDITDIPGCCEGDEVTLLGGPLPYSTVASFSGTNRNECLSILSRRPVRIYHKGGKIVTVLDELTGERRDF